MGCTGSSAVKTIQVQETVRPVSELRLSTELLQRIRQQNTFKCEVVSLMTLHNHFCLAREKKDIKSLLILDCSSDKDHLQPSPLGLFRCQNYDLSRFDTQAFSEMILFKTVFFVGVDSALLQG
jgi:hypothetical protein